MNAKDNILKKFKDGSFACKTDEEICRLLKIPKTGNKEIRTILHKLCDEGELYHDYSFHYGTMEQLGLIEGKVSGNERGFGFLMPTDKQTYASDFFIPHRGLHGAMHGDTVLAVPVKSMRSDDEVEIVKILKRGYTTIVGTFIKDNRGGWLEPDEKKYFQSIFIPLALCKNLENGVKAIAEITDYPQGKAPGGKIIEVLGDSNDFFVEELSLIRGHNLREEFPDTVINAAEETERQGISSQDLKNRKDFRDKLIITVDGEDTRDIDDAFSIEKQGDNFILGVHIADVSNYVPYKGILDKEAYTRATSVYFPDRVLPMLPKALSNGICSLNEGEDRLTMSCVMTIDKKGNVISKEITRGIINSSHRMTYHQIDNIFNGEEQAVKEYPDLVDMINNAMELTDILDNMRTKRGSVDLDVKEVKIMLDENGNIVIPDYEHLKSHKMIEQFMVIANESVAERMNELKMPFVYRIHEKPSAEKAKTFLDFLESLGINAKFNTDEVKPGDFQKILNSLEGQPIFSVVNRVMLRSMMKARYAPVNVGHFGLSSACYCHFTSPIRRYPDLCIHRIIKMAIDGMFEQAHQKYDTFVQEASIQSSECERVATEAERDVDDLYTTQYMHEHIGEEYSAVISGVTNFGIFAELPNTIEGMIPIEALPQDNYQFIEEHFLLKGQSNSFRIGEEIQIKVMGCDFSQREVEFAFLKKL